VWEAVPRAFTTYVWSPIPVWGVTGYTLLFAPCMMVVIMIRRATRHTARPLDGRSWPSVWGDGPGRRASNKLRCLRYYGHQHSRYFGVPLLWLFINAAP